MAAPDATASRLGQINGGGDADALFLKKFAGEVLTTFQTETVFLDKHLIRTIENGKSAQFPATGRFTAGYHTPGVFLTGGSTNHAERIITIDDLLLAQAFVAHIDELKNHYDVRSIYSGELGGALARAFDSNVARVGLNAARAAATVTGGDGGSVITSANSATVGADIATALFSAAQKLDEKNVGENDRYAFLKPAQYYILAQTTNVINRDWGGLGAYAEGQVLKVAGVHVVKTNLLPSTNVNTGPTAYQGNFTTTSMLVMNKMAVGTVKLLDLAMESEWLIQNQGTLMVAKYAMGHGILRPECAVEVKTA